MKMSDGQKEEVNGVKVTYVEKLGDRAKFKSAKDIEVRLAEVPEDDAACAEYVAKVVQWATDYYAKVEEAKKAGSCNPRQIKKDCFIAIFGAVEGAKPVRRVTTVRPQTPSAPVTKEAISPKLDPKKLAEQFDTVHAEDLPDSGKKDDLPPLMDDEVDLLGEGHVVAGDDVLKEVAPSVDISSLGDGASIFD